MLRFIIILTLILTTSCTRSKDTYSPNLYTNVGCDKILTEIDYARRYKNSLHKNDKFMLRYLLVIPAIIETFQIVRNEHKVNKRIAELQIQAQNNQCYQHEANVSSTFVPYTQEAAAPRNNGNNNNSSHGFSSSISTKTNSFFNSLKNIFK